MSWMVDNVGKVGAAGGGTLALLGLAFKDVFREWWRDHQALREEERRLRASQREGGQLAHELLGIINRNMTSSDTRIADLTVTLKLLATAIERLATVTDISHRLLSETRDNVIEIKGRLSS